MVIILKSSLVMTLNTLDKIKGFLNRKPFLKSYLKSTLSPGEICKMQQGTFGTKIALMMFSYIIDKHFHIIWD